MYTSVTLIQQKIGRSLTADEASFATTVAIPAITERISNYLGINYDDANGAFVTYAHDHGSCRADCGCYYCEIGRAHV